MRLGYSKGFGKLYDRQNCSFPLRPTTLQKNMPLGNILDAERNKKVLKGINRRRKRIKSIRKLKQRLTNQT